MQKYWYKDKCDADIGEPGTPGVSAIGRSAPAREKPDLTSAADGIAPSTRPFPHTLQIGQVAIRPATVLAPMAGVTDTVFRRFIKNLGGCGLIMTEFTSADGVLRSKKTAGRIERFRRKYAKSDAAKAEPAKQ